MPKLETGNLYDLIPINPAQEVFNVLAQKDTVKIERIISNGQSSPESGWFDQEQDEWVIVLKGKAVLTFADAQEIKLKSGDYLNIPAHTPHKVSWTDPRTETIWLAVHY